MANRKSVGAGVAAFMATTLIALGIGKEATSQTIGTTTDIATPFCTSCFNDVRPGAIQWTYDDDGGHLWVVEQHFNGTNVIPGLVAFKRSDYSSFQPERQVAALGLGAANFGVNAEFGKNAHNAPEIVPNGGSQGILAWGILSSKRAATNLCGSMTGDPGSTYTCTSVAHGSRTTGGRANVDYTDPGSFHVAPFAMSEAGVVRTSWGDILAGAVQTDRPGALNGYGAVSGELDLALHTLAGWACNNSTDTSPRYCDERKMTSTQLYAGEVMPLRSPQNNTYYRINVTAFIPTVEGAFVFDAYQGVLGALTTCHVKVEFTTNDTRATLAPKMRDAYIAACSKGITPVVISRYMAPTYGTGIGLSLDSGDIKNLTTPIAPACAVVTGTAALSCTSADDRLNNSIRSWMGNMVNCGEWNGHFYCVPEVPFPTVDYLKTGYRGQDSGQAWLVVRIDRREADGSYIVRDITGTHTATTSIQKTLLRTVGPLAGTGGGGSCTFKPPCSEPGAPNRKSWWLLPPPSSYADQTQKPFIYNWSMQTAQANYPGPTYRNNSFVVDTSGNVWVFWSAFDKAVHTQLWFMEWSGADGHALRNGRVNLIPNSTTTNANNMKATFRPGTQTPVLEFATSACAGWSDCGGPAGPGILRYVWNGGKFDVQVLKRYGQETPGSCGTPVDSTANLALVNLSADKQRFYTIVAPKLNSPNDTCLRLFVDTLRPAAAQRKPNTVLRVPSCPFAIGLLGCAPRSK